MKPSTRGTGCVSDEHSNLAAVSCTSENFDRFLLLEQAHLMRIIGNSLAHGQLLGRSHRGADGRFHIKCFRQKSNSCNARSA